MEVVVHEAKGVRLETGLFRGLGQAFEKILAVHAAEKVGLPPIATVHDACRAGGLRRRMIDRARIFSTPGLRGTKGKLRPVARFHQAKYVQTLV
jgi:hypothetical protein